MIYDIAWIVASQGLALAAAEFLRRIGTSVKVSRKCAHVFAGIAAASMPFFVSKESAVLCGVTGTVLIGFSVWKGYLPAIGESGAFDPGAIFFPFGLTIAALFFWNGASYGAYQYAAMMLAIPDALAGLIGARYGKESNWLPGNKSLVGVIVFFASAYMISLVFLPIAYLSSLLKVNIAAIAAGVVLTAVEAFSIRGVDNLTVPLAAGVIAQLLI